jgi:hypothetical protein
MLSSFSEFTHLLEIWENQSLCIGMANRIMSMLNDACAN